MGPDLVFDSSDIVPSDAGDKLTHQAHHDHKHGAAHVAVQKKTAKDDVLSKYQGDKLIDDETRSKYKWSKTFNGATMGAATFTLFTGLFIGTKYLVSHFLEGALLSSAGGYVVAGLVSAAIVGAIWQGVKNHFDADKDVDQYNKEVLERFKDGRGKGRGVDEIEQGANARSTLAQPEPMVMVVTPDFITGQHQHHPQQDDIAAEGGSQRPEYLSKIIDDGPKSLDPKEMLARMEEEKAASQDRIPT
ncbi:MAG: hypothetical protein MRY32_08065 [Rickettsiales bacterium]|nr:hypothetical protein [Rickettsiales bacterium]